MMLHQTNWGTLFSLAVAYFAVAGPSLADARLHSATSSHVSTNAESLTAREVSTGDKPTLVAFERASGNPYKAYEESLKLNKRSTEGVFHLPVFRRESPDAKLHRRANTPSTTTARTNIDPQLLVVPVTVGGKAQNYTFSVTSDYNTARNVEDNPKSFDPSKYSKAKKLGSVKDDFDDTATEYTLDDMELFGGVPVNGASLLYLDANGNKQTLSNGDLGFGLKGSGGFSDAKGKTTLEVLLESKVLAQDVFSLALGAGALTDPGVLLLGASVEAATGDSPVYSKSSKDRWALDITVSGHKGKADLSLDSVYFTTPPDVATDLIKKAGLKPIKNQAGDIVAEVDCVKGTSKAVTIELEGVNLVLHGPATVIHVADKKCYFMVQGSEQGKYPTPYTLGEAIFLSYNVYFDLSGDTPKIGFALPSKASPPSEAGKELQAADDEAISERDDDCDQNETRGWCWGCDPHSIHCVDRRRREPVEKLTKRELQLDAELKRRCDNNESYGWCWSCDPHDYHCDHERRRALEKVMAAERAELEDKAASQLARDVNPEAFCDPDDDGGGCAIETRNTFCDPDDDGGGCAIETRNTFCDPDDDGGGCAIETRSTAAPQVKREDGCDDNDGYCIPCQANDPDCERRRRRDLDAFCDPDDDGGSCALLPARAEARRKVAEAVAARSAAVIHCDPTRDVPCTVTTCEPSDPECNPHNGNDGVTKRAAKACDPENEECGSEEEADCDPLQDPDCLSHPRRSNVVRRGTGPYGCDPDDGVCIAFKGVPSCNPFTGENCHNHKRSNVADEGDGPYGCDPNDTGCIIFKNKPSCNPFTGENCHHHKRSNVEDEGDGPYGCDPDDTGCIIFKNIPSCNPFTGENCHNHKRSNVADEGDGPYGCDPNDTGCIIFKNKPSCNPFTGENCPGHERSNVDSRGLKIPACDPEFDPTCGFAFCDPKDPGCKRSDVVNKRLEAPECDPQIDPGCGFAVCDPDEDPNCGQDRKRSVIISEQVEARECDPEDDPDCAFYEDPSCNPDKDPGCIGHRKRSGAATKRLEALACDPLFDDCGPVSGLGCNPLTDPSCAHKSKQRDVVSELVGAPPLSPYCDPQQDPLCPHSQQERAVGGPGRKKEGSLICMRGYTPECRTKEQWDQFFRSIGHKRALSSASPPRGPHRPLLCVPGDNPECNEHNMGGIGKGPHGR
ncbi:hypothetical protein BCV69DRAFT_69877 [Microstroma glucosiphilum]|uniref:Peptidase A1 domain-containing protein n=1 Tax=Pseudomicrostroma glucosiphilum TaxID=1684307 RepID=A0A316TZR5_9BASI|nr:hypothetical protein BCV69DRAFT_69877 [Pseudomicrostroma glucosiphilum]PWN18676.1 hypothetical protein BCV69DRAFT_69877 [Pseudomicrostroma glucosiphilum]